VSLGRYTILDVFTDRPLEGNPLAVFHDALELPSHTMQSLARELNLSETVFLGEAEADGDGEADARLRIFTPATELPFAGHPVLGAAFAVGGATGASVVRLHTAAGIVPVRLRRTPEGSLEHGEMDQPLPQEAPPPPLNAVMGALGAGELELPLAAYRNGPVHCLLALHDAEQVAALDPDLRALGGLGEYGFSCFAELPCAAGERTRVFKTRMFGPGVGVDEDPATGSAAGPLAVHLVRHGVVAPGETIRLHQGEEIRRPSVLWARAEGSPEQITRVSVGGSAVTVAHGNYHLG
jgi:trans-2,3-dihydro-3-hydroxyanthranilate isomerase